MDTNQVVARNIRSARKSLGWTQAELSDRIQAVGVPWSRAVLSYLENGDRPITVDEVAALCVVCGTTPGYWFTPLPEDFEDGELVVKVGDREVPGSWLVAAGAAGDAAPAPHDLEFSSWARMFDVLGKIVARDGLAAPGARRIQQTLARLRAAVEVGDEEP